MASWLKVYRYDRLDDNSTGHISWLRYSWQQGKTHVLYCFFLIVVAVSSYEASQQQSLSKYYGTEPMRSALRCKELS